MKKTEDEVQQSLERDKSVFGKKGKPNAYIPTVNPWDKIRI